MAEGFHGETEAETRGAFELGAELGDVHCGDGVDGVDGEYDVGC